MGCLYFSFGTVYVSQFCNMISARDILGIKFGCSILDSLGRIYSATSNKNFVIFVIYDNLKL
jgi:hypothetical protein